MGGDEGPGGSSTANGRALARGERTCCRPSGPCGACEARFIDLWRWRTHVLRFARRLGADEARAEDVVAEAYAAAWRRLPDVPRGDDEVRAWLCLTARRQMANLRRREAHQAAVAERLLLQYGGGFIEMAAAESHALVDGFRSLRPADREVLWLVATGTKGAADLARHLGCTVAALAVRLSRARKRLEASVHM